MFADRAVPRFGRLQRVATYASRWMGGLALVAGSVTTTGCFIDASSDPPPPPVVESGRLTVRWTVDESIDSNRCVLGQAAAIDITVMDPAGRLVGEYQAACASFATTISPLYPARYIAEAFLIDSSGRARTTIVDIRPFDVIERTDLVVDLDFPADSFLDRLASDALSREAATTPPPERSSPANVAPSAPSSSRSVANPTR